MKRLLFITIIFSFFMAYVAVTNGQIIPPPNTTYTVRHGNVNWYITTWDSVNKLPADTVFTLDQDTIVKTTTTYIGVYDTIKVPIVTLQHDTMWQCGPTLTNWCPTRPVIVTPPPAVTYTSIFSTQIPPTATQNDGSGGIETGLKFTVSQSGFIYGARFYKTVGNSGTHIGELYSSTTRLAQATYSSETASGWQTVLFANKIPVTAGQTYTATYFNASGNYISTTGGLNAAITTAPLSTVVGTNGLYLYTKTAALPTSSYNGSNYWIDVLYSIK